MRSCRPSTPGPSTPVPRHLPSLRPEHPAQGWRLRDGTVVGKLHLRARLGQQQQRLTRTLMRPPSSCHAPGPFTGAANQPTAATPSLPPSLPAGNEVGHNTCNHRDGNAAVQGD